MGPHHPEAPTADPSALGSPLAGPRETPPSCLSVPLLWLPLFLFLCLSLNVPFAGVHPRLSLKSSCELKSVSPTAFLNTAHPSHTPCDSTRFSSDSRRTLPHSLPETISWSPTLPAFQRQLPEPLQPPCHTHRNTFTVGKEERPCSPFSSQSNLLQALAYMPPPSSALPNLWGRAEGTLAALYPSLSKSGLTLGMPL